MVSGDARLIRRESNPFDSMANGPPEDDYKKNKFEVADCRNSVAPIKMYFGFRVPAFTPTCKPDFRTNVLGCGQSKTKRLRRISPALACGKPIRLA
jgi:hypothetical protein